MKSDLCRKAALMLAVAAVCLLTALPAPAQVQQAPTRDEIDDQYKWNLADLYPTDDAWEEAYKSIQTVFPRFDAYHGKLGGSAEAMTECLELSDSVSSMVHRLWVYSGLKSDEDNRKEEYQEMLSRLYSLRSRFSQAVSFIEPEILAIPDATLEQFLDDNEQLGIYRFYIEDLIRRKSHILSPEKEELMAMLSPLGRAPSRIFTMMDDADIKYGTIIDEEGNEVELTRGRYSRFLESKNRDLRKRASDKYEFTYLDYENTLGATLASSIEKDWILAQARGYNSCLEANLDGNNIPRAVFDNLLEAVNANLAPMHKYVALRKKALGVDTLYKYDMYVPLVDNVKLEYTYDEAKELVLEGLKPLGKDYLKTLKMGMDSRWIDVYETVGKGSGGYNWGTYTVHPYILLNWINSLDNVFTLAHELGHAMHGFYTYKNEPYAYAGHSLFTAEVASTCNEAIMVKYMLGKAKTREEKLYLLNYYINQIIGTFYTQVMFSEFELKTHEIVEQGGALSAKQMRQIYREIYEKYNGPDYFLEENKDLGCLRISHFYRQYYVYQYSTSYAAAQLLANKILNKEKGAIEAYTEFIKTGSSAYPVEILQRAGIDMNGPEPINAVIQTFSDLVDEFEKVLLEN